jgi:hypothetical protein
MVIYNPATPADAEQIRSLLKLQISTVNRGCEKRQASAHRRQV